MDTPKLLFQPVITAPQKAVVRLRNGFPINMLGRIQAVPEVREHLLCDREPGRSDCGRDRTGRDVLGVIYGSSRKGIETPTHAAVRVELLQKFGYKR